MPTDLNSLIQFITPTVLVSILVFLVIFFGKILTDELPFAGDRKWHEELSGIMFIFKYFVFNFYLLVLVAVFYKTNEMLNNGYWIWASGFILVGVYSHLISRMFFYFFKIDLFAKIATDEKMISTLKEAKYPAINEFKNFFLRLQKIYSKKITVSELKILSSLSLFFSLVIFFSSANIVCKVLFGFFLFIFFTSIAVADSFLRAKDVLVDIVLTNGEVLERCILLKMNKDNLKYKQNDQFYILNKDSFLKFKVITKMPKEFVKKKQVISSEDVNKK